MEVTLRDYQQHDVNSIRTAYSSGFRDPLYVAPTGSGKTVIFCYIAERAVALGNPVLILVHRKELLMQCSNSLDALGVEHGLICPGHTITADPVQVGSVQTIVRRLDRVIVPKMIIYDEAHHRVAGSWEKIGEYFQGVRTLGVTATPLRLDGRGLGEYFDKLIVGATVRELTDAGYLSPFEVYAPPIGIDTSGIKSKYGDYDKSSMDELFSKPKIMGDCVKHYQRLCPGTQAIAFCYSINHAKSMANEFNKAGIASECIDGTLNDSDRKRRIDGLSSGRIKVLTSCDIVSEGTDIPIVTTAILLRPTKSLGLYLQQVGRVLRPFEGKEKAYILDHVGNVFRHGFPDEVREWTLDGTLGKFKGEIRDFRQCQACYAVYSLSLDICPQCGCERTIKERLIDQVEGNLEKVEKDQLRYSRRREVAMSENLADLEKLAMERGYKPGWAQYVWESRQKKAGVAL